MRPARALKTGQGLTLTGIYPNAALAERHVTILGRCWTTPPSYGPPPSKRSWPNFAAAASPKSGYSAYSRSAMAESGQESGNLFSLRVAPVSGVSPREMIHRAGGSRVGLTTGLSYCRRRCRPAHLGSALAAPAASGLQVVQVPSGLSAPAGRHFTESGRPTNSLDKRWNMPVMAGKESGSAPG